MTLQTWKHRGEWPLTVAALLVLLRSIDRGSSGPWSSCSRCCGCSGWPCRARWSAEAVSSSSTATTTWPWPVHIARASSDDRPAGQTYVVPSLVTRSKTGWIAGQSSVVAVRMSTLTPGR
ncbi:MAG: hypothetical protein ACRYG2_13830 [Janthinobacterium lividum]